MFYVITTLIGVFFICIGSVEVGIFLLIPAVFVIVKKIVNAISYHVNDKHYEKERKEAMEREKQERQQARQQSIEAQRQLVEHYKNSNVTHEVLNTICKMRPGVNYPERIEIFDERIQALYHGELLSYNFADHRVHSFAPAYKTVWRDEELEEILRPQIAMANAINALLYNKYVIRDNATLNRSGNKNHTFTTYSSKNVLLILKTTLPNREF